MKRVKKTLPEGKWKGDIHSDSHCVEVKNIHSYSLQVKQEVWFR